MRHLVPNRSLKHGFEYVIGLVAVVAALGLAGCGGGSGGGESQVHVELTTLCQQATGGNDDYCGCVADESIKRGYDTATKVSQLKAVIISISQTGDLTQLPAAVNDAVNACGSSQT